jgi:transposase InsO family protein
LEDWLSGQNTYTLHRPVHKKSPRNPHTITNIEEMDLAHLSSLSKYNGKYKYLLNVIDIRHGWSVTLNVIDIRVFSRYGWSVTLKDKNATLITAALKSSFHNRKPISIQSDKGTDFVNTSVQRYLKHQGVNFHTSHNPDKGRHY